MKKIWSPFLCLISSTILGLSMFSNLYAAPFAYIPNSGSNNVSVIDTASNSVVATVAAGTSPYGVAVAVKPSETFTYITNFGSDDVSVIRTYIDILSRVVFEKVREISVGRNPYGIAVDPAGTYAYVTNSGDGTVSKIDLVNYNVLPAIPVGSTPTGIVVSPDGTNVYVVNNASGTVSVISAADNTNVITVRVGTNPVGAAVNPLGTFVYVTNSADNSISVINATDNSVITKWDLHLANPWGVAVNPAGTLAYITNFNSSSVSLFDTSSNSVNTPNIGTGTNPVGVSLNTDGTFTYVVNSSQGTVSVIDNLTNTVSKQVSVGTRPYALGSFIAPIGKTVPTVTSTFPVNDAKDMSTDVTIQATFSDIMDASTINSSTFLVSGGITGAVTYDSVNKVATLKPATAFSRSTTYTVTLTTGIRNMNGNSLASNYAWNFRTSEAGKGDCFIATAVYGSYDDIHVKALRAFRDKYLLSNSWGVAIVNDYYKYSPPLADFIRAHNSLKVLMKWLLTTVVYFIQYPYFLLLIIGMLSIIIIRRNKRYFKYALQKLRGPQ